MSARSNHTNVPINPVFPLCMVPISTPAWVKKMKGYCESAFKVDMLADPNDSSEAIVVKYAFKSNPNNGYAKVFFQTADGREWDKTRLLWKEAARRLRLSGRVQKFTLRNDGRITGPIGMPTTDELHSALNDLLVMQYNWAMFPKENDYDKVLELTEARISLNELNAEIESGLLKASIDGLRVQVSKIQKRIQEEERYLNEIYENGADAMNVLEANGYPAVLKEPGCADASRCTDPI